MISTPTSSPGVILIVVPSLSILHPQSLNFWSNAFRCSGITGVTINGDLVIAAAIRKVPASILSGIISISAATNSFTPYIINVSVPTPFILAPILFKKSQSCVISCSLAQL